MAPRSTQTTRSFRSRLRRRVLAWTALTALGGAAAQAQAPVRAGTDAAQLPFDDVRILVDASGSMRARFGDRTRMQAAVDALRTLDRRLSAAGARAPDVWTFGAGSHRLERDCSDVERVAGVDAVSALEPRGVSPLVHALERLRAHAADPGREAWVVLTDDGDTCGRDPCAWAAEALARRPRPRIYVVGLGLEPEAAAALRCLTEPSSGYLLDLRSGDDGTPVERLAAVMRNRGSVRIDVRGPGGVPVEVQGRVFRVGGAVPVAVVRSGRDEELPGGLYRVELETLPPTVLDRVLVLPGGERSLRVADLGAVVASAWTEANEPLPAGVTVAPDDTSAAERYASAGTPVLVRPGRYRVSVEVGDSVALRETVEVAPGELRRLAVGGRGWLRARAGGLAPQLPVELQSYATGRTTVVRPWAEPAPVAGGTYRARVPTLPPYVREELTVSPAETTALDLAGLGTLSVEVRDGRGRPVPARVTLLRRERREGKGGEPAPRAILGTFTAGEPQTVLEGTYDLLVERGAARLERGVRVTRGADRVVRISLGAGDAEGS